MRPATATMLAAAAALICAVPLAASAADPAAGSAAGSQPHAGVPLSEAHWRTKGRWITDQAGRVVITQGVNEVEKSSPYAPDAIGFDEEDAVFLAEHGFTSVRLGVLWVAVEPKPGQYDDAYLARLRRTVDMLSKHGIASLLDFHQDMAHEKFQGEGWPGWAVLDNGMPNTIKAGFPGNYFMNEALKYAFDNFQNNAKASDGVGVADHYAKAWGHVAGYFKGVDGVMGYDLYNEPFPGHGYSGCMVMVGGCVDADAKLAAVQQKSIDAIRANDPASTVWYEPNQFFNIGKPTNVHVKGENLGFSFHDYCVNQATLKSYAGCEGPDKAVFDNAEAHSKASGSGLLLTEFGAITVPEVITAQSDLADRRMVGWQWWAYTSGDPTTAGPGGAQALVYTPLKPPTGENVDWKKLDLIARVHPDRVAGTPTAYRWDRTAKTFTMSWSTTKVGGGSAGDADETTVVVPSRLRGKGYTVKANGAKVVSAPGDAVLRLVRLPGAATADVTVKVG